MKLVILIVFAFAFNIVKADQSCGANEVFNPCGSHCVRDCEHLLINYMCIQGCNSGCFCQNGFIRDKPNGKCIKEDQCPDNCDKQTEKFILGIKQCENVCGTGVDPACAYTEYMPMKTCFCKTGFIREPISGKCVHANECSKV